MKYANGFVLLMFVVLTFIILVGSCQAPTHLLRGYFTDIGALDWLAQC